MKITYLILSIMLLLCLAPMPYGYYVLVRFIAMIAFVVSAYIRWQCGQQSLAVVFGALALLFQPFIKMHLGRTMWNLVDVVVALGIITLYLKEYRRRK